MQKATGAILAGSGYLLSAFVFLPHLTILHDFVVASNVAPTHWLHFHTLVLSEEQMCCPKS